MAEGESVAGPIMEIGNTNSRYRFATGARRFVNDWNSHGPAHHCAVGVGHIADRIERLGSLLRIPVESRLLTHVIPPEDIACHQGTQRQRLSPHDRTTVASVLLTAGTVCRSCWIVRRARRRRRPPRAIRIEPR